MRLPISTNNRAFTIVELLIVIVVIGILAAITVVAYNGVQERARASAASSALSQASKKIKLWQVDNPDTAPDCSTFASLIGVSGSSCNLTSGDIAYQYTAGSNGTYCMTATKDVTSYKITDNSQPILGGCSGHGVGGVAAITNLVANPTVASNSTGWTSLSSSGGTFTSARTTLVSGLSAIGVTTAQRITLSTAPSSWWRNQYGTVSVTAGETYTFSAYIRPSVTTSTGVIILWRNSSGTTMSENASSFSGHSANTWARRSVTATAPAGAVTVNLHMGAGSGGVQDAYLDSTAAMFTVGSNTPNYADGNTENWVWNGTVNNSTSTGRPL
jgi:prepilin-type N-terminal cleavage/methylation domain-containing protein